MALRNAYQTSVIIALIMKRSNQTRARISTKTIKLASKRLALRSAFIRELTDCLVSNFDIVLVEINNGGFGLIKSSALDGAKSLTIKKLLNDKERNDLKQDVFDFDDAEFEVAPDPFEDDDHSS